MIRSSQGEKYDKYIFIIDFLLLTSLYDQTEEFLYDIIENENNLSDPEMRVF